MLGISATSVKNSAALNYSVEMRYHISLRDMCKYDIVYQLIFKYTDVTQNRLYGYFSLETFNLNFYVLN